MAYKQRVADALLERKLKGKGAVLIEGPKWCGKTTTAKQIAKSVLDLGDTDVYNQSERMIALSSSALLEGATPRLIDEWQTLPALWDSVRSEVDKRSDFAQFILTGSAVPPKEKTRHSGTGRIGRLRMRPMSLWESGESDGRISLSALFDGLQTEVLHCENDLKQLAFLTCRGGWPQATLLSGDLALDQAIDYYEAVTNTDIQRVDDVRRSPERARMLLRSYARNIATQTPYSTLRADMLQHDSQTLNEDTVIDYADALRKIFVIEDSAAWNPNLRSKTAIRTSDTRYFVDPSIAAAALGIGPNDLINDLQTFGLLFENLVVRDLRVYADALNGQIYHYRDANGLECDAVLHRRDGSYGLIEVKLGGTDNIDAGAATLNKLADNIDTNRMKAPAFKMVVIGVGSYAYQRPDRVCVIPINLLKP